MADAARLRRLVLLGLIWALVVASVDVAQLWAFDGGKLAAPLAASVPVPASTVPSSSVPATAVSPPATAAAAEATPRHAPVTASGATTSAGATVVEPDPIPPVTEPTTTVPPADVTCASDLPLADSPDVPFNFLCVRDGVPVTWSNDSIRLFSSGLTPEQTSALQVALPQWQRQGRFRVTTVNSASEANVTIGPGVLDNSEDGHTVVHYTCLVTCAFDHVDIELSSTRELTKPLWITTILHELGHAAGLNHVSRKSQVMYPELDVLSPEAYADGDLAGLRELARIRSS